MAMQPREVRAGLFVEIALIARLNRPEGDNVGHVCHAVRCAADSHVAMRVSDQDDRCGDGGEKVAHAVGVALDTSRRVGGCDDGVTVPFQNFDDAVPTRGIGEGSGKAGDSEISSLRPAPL